MEKEWRKKEFHDYYRINRMYCGRPRCRPWNGSCGTFCGGGRFAYADHISASEEQKIRQSILCGVLIGFICGFVGAGGGMMLLLVLTSVLGYELKTAVGTSVFIMTFTALTGAVSHFYIGGKPNLPIMIACVISTLVFAQLGAKWANSANVKMLNRVTGILLCVLGMVMLFF